jgi:glutamate/tyrosine decarboxylase-like PLP-dependent enzyme
MGQFDRDTLPLLDEALATLEQGFRELPDLGPVPDLDRLRPVLLEVATRLQDNYPYHHPLYAGQMLKPPHPVARLAYALAMFVNPNNHALDGGRASSAMEKEAVAALAAMFGMARHLGHLTSGGTFANLEALWVAGRERPGVVLASDQAHYTHARISAVLGLAFEPVASDRHGRMDLDALERRLARGGVGTVVATLGTTALGAVDPLPEVLALAERHGARVHADAAYGGYFTLAASLGPAARAAFDALRHADSVVVDPHKHGLQPYGCGAVLFADPAVGRHYSHDSPYTYFSSSELHLGEISLECSRAGASAVALWATQRLLPLVPGGELARGLDAGITAARELHSRLAADARARVALPPELDIVVWGLARPGAVEAGAAADALFEAAAARGLHLAKVRLPRALLAPWWGDALAWDAESVTCLRSVLMKPEHLAWLPEVWARLDAATDAAR